MSAQRWEYDGSVLMPVAGRLPTVRQHTAAWAADGWELVNGAMSGSGQWIFFWRRAVDG